MNTAPNVITGNLLVSDTCAYVLFDPGATHSFISLSFASQLLAKPEPLGYDLCVRTPLGCNIVVNTVLRDFKVAIENVEFSADLIVMPIRDFDIILGMDWLTAHRAKLDCFTKEIELRPAEGTQITFKGEREVLASCLISASTAAQLIQNGCEAYLAYVIDSQLDRKSVV